MILNLTVASLAFLKGYMYKEAVDTTPFSEWAANTGSATYYNAIADAEHRNRPGTRFIRAGHVPGGTTAYGPVQANKTYLADFAPTGRYKDVLSGSPRLQKYVAGLSEQANKFAQHGNMKGKLPNYDPKYGYFNKSGTGLGNMGSTDVQKALYKSALTKMMEHRVKTEFGGDWNKYLVQHRGRDAKQDPDYYKAYNDSLKRQHEEYLRRQAERRAAAGIDQTLATK